MVKFYTSFPVSMDGNQLSISMAPEDMDIKDEVNNRFKPSFFLALTKSLRSNLFVCLLLTSFLFWVTYCF